MAKDVPERLVTAVVNYYLASSIATCIPVALRVTKGYCHRWTVTVGLLSPKRYPIAGGIVALQALLVVISAKLRQASEQ